MPKHKGGHGSKTGALDVPKWDHKKKSGEYIKGGKAVPKGKRGPGDGHDFGYEKRNQPKPG